MQIIKKQGQTATEYLIMLAIVIIIAVTIIFVLSRVPEVGGSSNQNIGLLNWKIATIGIDSYKMSSNSDDSIRIINNVGSDIRLTNMTIDGVQVINGSITILTGRSIPISSQFLSDAVLATSEFGCTNIVAGQKFSYPMYFEYQIIKTSKIENYTNNGILFEGTCAE
jgi:uncharacterized protein (UPF0333 family)